MLIPYYKSFIIPLPPTTAPAAADQAQPLKTAKPTGGATTAKPIPKKNVIEPAAAPFAALLQLHFLAAKSGFRVVKPSPPNSIGA